MQKVGKGKGVTLPTFRILEPPLYLGNGLS